MTSSSALIARGVNPREMMPRVWVCSGASWLMITNRVSSTASRVAVSGYRMIAPFSRLEKTLLFFETAATSACLLTAQ